MVNLGGRSKGCSTCRRRRVKCDEQRPVCRQCERNSLECDGPKDTVFIQGKIVSSRRTVKRAAVLTTCDTGDTASLNRQMPLSASVRGSDHEIYICYTRKHFRRGGPIDLALDDPQLGDIITAGTSTANGRIFHPAILSFATICFGTQNRQARIIDQGYTMHGVALKQLNQALSDTRCHTSDEVILAVATLAILESLVPTGPKHYLQHMMGLGRLLELRDPRLYCSPKSTELYRAVRHMIVFASLRTGRPSVLARPEWKETLSANCSVEELQEQELYNVLADCTVLHAERDKILANWKLHPEKSMNKQAEIQRSAMASLTQIYTWRKRWERDETNVYSQNATIPPTLQPPPGSVEDCPPTSPAHFHSANDSAITMLMLYNTTLIYVFRVLTSVTLDYNRDKHIAAERLAALEICRCILFYLDRKQRSDPPSSPVVHWAVSTAWMTLRDEKSAEGKWSMGILNGMTKDVVAKAVWAT